MESIELATWGLAAWRLAYMVTREAGPGRVFTRLRAWEKVGVTRCLYCASVWTGALAAAVGSTEYHWLLWPFAVSALGIMAAAFTNAGIVWEGEDDPNLRNN